MKRKPGQQTPDEPTPPPGVAVGDELRIRLAQGELLVKVEETKEA